MNNVYFGLIVFIIGLCLEAITRFGIVQFYFPIQEGNKNRDLIKFCRFLQAIGLIWFIIKVAYG